MPSTVVWPYAERSAAGKRIIARDIAPEHGFQQVSRLMREQIELEVRSGIGGNAQRMIDVTTTCIDKSCALLLLPAWLVS